MIDNLLLGISTAITPINLAYCFVGCLLGTLIGVLPGIGTVATLSMLMPYTYTLGPTTTLIMMAGIYYGAQYGGSTTSILVNTPGETSSVMTCIDGHQMAKQGRAGVAIVTAGLASFIAGVIATIVIAFLSPQLSTFAFLFGPPEYSALALLGLVSISIITNQNMIAGLGMAALGVLLGLIGTDVNSGVDRFTAGTAELIDGVGVANIAIGMFGVAELIKNIIEKDTSKVVTQEIRLMPSRIDIKRMIPSTLRGSIVGSILGLLPGGGATMASYMAYILEKKVSKFKSMFGNGAIEGVAAPEAANNAAAQVGFIPLLAIGIPENAVMAIMMATMIIAGIQPGPNVIVQQPELFWGLTISMLIGNIILLILNVPLVKIWVKLIEIPKKILYPLIFIFCVYGAYSVNNNYSDVWLMLTFGIVGYIFTWCNISPAPLMLGYVLGPLFEEYIRRSLIMSRGDFMPFITRPISATLLFIVSIFVIWSIIRPQVDSSKI